MPYCIKKIGRYSKDFMVIKYMIFQGKGLLPDGRAELEAEELLLTSVTRQHAGLYRCTASNGFGKGDTKASTRD